MLYSGHELAIVHRRYLAIPIVAVFVAGCSSEGEGPGHRPQALALRPEQELASGAVGSIAPCAKTIGMMAHQ